MRVALAEGRCPGNGHPRAASHTAGSDHHSNAVTEDRVAAWLCFVHGYGQPIYAYEAGSSGKADGRACLAWTKGQDAGNAHAKFLCPSNSRRRPGSGQVPKPLRPILAITGAIGPAMSARRAARQLPALRRPLPGPIEGASLPVIEYRRRGLWPPLVIRHRQSHLPLWPRHTRRCAGCAGYALVRCSPRTGPR